MFNHFTKEKSDFLKKKDKSKKGYVDKDVKEIIDLLNSKKDYYTTSSCAGRIVLLEMKSKIKDECDWIFTKHDKVKFEEIENALNEYNNNNKNKKNRELPLKVSKKEETSFGSNAKNPIWFKQQPLILHVACRNLDAANKLLNISRKIFRRAGIIGITNRKVMVEIIGDERLETIIAGKNFVADESYIKNLVKYANENFDDNGKKTERFLKSIQNL